LITQNRVQIDQVLRDLISDAKLDWSDVTLEDGELYNSVAKKNVDFGLDAYDPVQGPKKVTCPWS